MWQAIIGAVAGGLFTGITTGVQNARLRDEYANYADDIRRYGKAYSGRNADTAMRRAGSDEALYQNNRFMPSNTYNTSNLSVQNALRNRPTDYSQQGQSLGKATKASELNSKYNAATTKAQQALNQAKIDYKAGQQGIQSGLNGLGTLASTYKQIAPSIDQDSLDFPSDEKLKEGYHNKEGLPDADAADALRQIESVEYKYKPETGLDQDYHVGTTAQSYEGTAFEDVVKDNGNYKELDKQKLLEAVMAGTAALQKELDALMGERFDTLMKYSKTNK